MNFKTEKLREITKICKENNIPLQALETFA